MRIPSPEHKLGKIRTQQSTNNNVSRQELKLFVHSNTNTDMQEPECNYDAARV